MMKKSQVIILSVLLALFAAFARSLPAQSQQKTFSLDAMRNLVSVSSPAIAPNGSAIAIVVSRPDYETNEYKSKLVLVDIDTGSRKVLTPERSNVSKPAWSPDGSLLGFLSPDESNVQQAWALPIVGGEAHKLTNAPRGVQYYAWRPDGEAVAYVTMDEDPEREGEARFLEAFEAGYSDIYLEDPLEPLHIWLVPTSGGEAERLTSGNWSIHNFLPPAPNPSPISWSPDGSSIAFVARPNAMTGINDSSTVRILNVDSGDVRGLTGSSGAEMAPSFSPDGETISFWSWRSEPGENTYIWGTTEVWLAPACGGEGRSLTRPLDRNLWLSKWIPNGKSIITAGNHETTVGLWQYFLDGGPERIELGNLVLSSSFGYDVAVGGDGSIAFVASTEGSPVELYYMDSPEAEPMALTDYNSWIGEYRLGNTERMTWQSDDFTADGVIIYPPEFDSRGSYPLVLLIHGGPQSASKQSFSILGQLMAARGWVVFQPNYRGSDNLGNEYQTAVVGDPGAGPGRDVMAGVDAMTAQPYIDSSRMAVTGWSYGGFMTTWLAGNYPNRWKAAMAGAAVTDLRDQYNLSDLNVSYRYSMHGLSPWSDEGRELYSKNSPITYATDITAPTLIMSATHDYRVPVSQSLKLFHALDDNGVKTELILYPGRTHFPSDPVNSMDVYRRWLEWVDEHIPEE